MSIIYNVYNTCGNLFWNVMSNVKNFENDDTFVSLNIAGNLIPELRHANDIVFLSNSPRRLEQLILAWC